MTMQIFDQKGISWSILLLWCI